MLDVGTGTALIPIELCEQSPHIRITAVDLADEMLKRAEINCRRAGWENRITLQKIDAKGLPYGDGTFDSVVSNTIIHHIPQPRQALAEMHRVVAPGGLLFVAGPLSPGIRGRSRTFRPDLRRDRDRRAAAALPAVVPRP